MLGYDLFRMRRMLKKAQQTYGFANQITVAVEELCELAYVLTKYPRYPEHQQAMDALKEQALDEFADVSIVMEHVQMIFGFTPEETERAINRKLKRLERWLEQGPDMLITTQDREVK